MEIGQILWLVVVGILGYYLVMNFTHGVKLFPRDRDKFGAVIKHPLHTVEAFFWPIAWSVWALYWTLACLLRIVITMGYAAFWFGQQAGDVEPSTASEVQRRLNDIRRPTNQH